MPVKLVSHVSGDGDLLEAWFKYYLGLGVNSFHLIVHGTPEQNARLFELKNRFPIVLSDIYTGEFKSEEKKRRIDSLLATMAGQWVLCVDSDEFVEFPFRRITSTIRMLELAGGNLLFAPMLQHMKLDGSLDTPEVIDDPFETFPLCSVALYKQMGSRASINKFPLFYCTNGTALAEGGNHSPPKGVSPVTRSLLGVTHHFKFRRSVLDRLNRRINSSHSFRHESQQFLRYLEKHNNHLPLDGTFSYSRGELYRRGLLRKFSVPSAVRWAGRSALKRINFGEANTRTSSRTR